jgi:DNA polymerase-3 subunit gamma/tau
MASLYRRHRPRSFDDVVGQEHVVRTLRNAIEQDKVHHAYLFVGSRGTGKTSMAKILAASLNCVNGPTVKPCGVCESCVTIASATSLDVIEMDAASNNSVDDIRDLRERVAYAPVSGRSKVYILDEAHMLTTAAWNAFLKTLEEPPPHTIFVLATTEAQKVLPTVVDRCHRFDFSRPTVPQIAGVLRRVADSEGIQVPDEATALMARSATGSFRDALGTLEQLVAYSGRTIALEDVLAVLGAADAELLFGTIDAVARGDVREALLAAARMSESGRDVARFFSDLETHLRGLMIAAALGEVPAELTVTPEQDARLAEQARRTPPAVVTRLLDLLADGMKAMKDGADARTQLELALIKAADPARDASTKALLGRIERLEARLAGGAAPAPGPAPARAHAPDVPATPAGHAVARPAPAPAPAAAPQPAPAAPVGVAAPAPVPTRPTAPPVATATVATAEGPATVVAAPVAAPGGAPGVAVAVTSDHALDVASLRELWPAVLEQLSESALGAFLAEALPVSLSGEELTIAWGESGAIMMKQAERPANRETIASAVRAVTGNRGIRLAFELRSEDEIQSGAGAGPAAPEMSEEQLIDKLVAEFDAVVLPPEEETT